MRRPFIAGNWKMNLAARDAVRLAQEIRERIGSVPDRDVAVCPTFVSVSAVAAALEDSPIGVGGQDCSQWDDGAYTGDISASILRSASAKFVILGHSERRHVMGETDEVVRAKMGKAREAGLKPILCVGETLEERKSGNTLAVVERQLRKGLEGLTSEDLAETTVAYEPVWAIGTGEVATPEQAQEVHAAIRGWLKDLGGPVGEDIRIQYGGSVKPDNVGGLAAMPDIDGALVGGAALKADSFSAIVGFGTA
ncbi:MAG: triose-phosphate isomerase [Planctomycetes bacterium]|nr:triose-phosphate isomerase [Planctomycetota bacterium]